MLNAIDFLKKLDSLPEYSIKPEKGLNWRFNFQYYGKEDY